jgi:hypothetical protein
MEEKFTTAKDFREKSFPDNQSIIEYGKLVAAEQRQLCADEYKRFIGRQSETDVITNILQAKIPEL